MNNIDKYSDKEWEELASLLSEESSDNAELLTRFQTEDKFDTVKKWNDLKIGSDMEIDVDNAWEKLSSRLESEAIPGKQRFIRRTLLKVAAAITILTGVGLGTLYLFNAGALTKNVTIITDSTQMNHQVTLPDGSKIFLNRNTKISYKSDFEKSGRLVSLEGEAFFEITPDPSHPFTVNAGDATISVLGTSFNVIAKYPESSIEVFVSTGMVSLADGSQNLIVDPGYVATISSDFSEKKINTNPNYISWKTGKLIYEGQKLDVVFNDLKNIYNVEIIATDPDILNQPITTVFDNEPIETKIRIICVTFNLRYQKDGDIYRLVKK